MEIILQVIRRFTGKTTLVVKWFSITIRRWSYVKPHLNTQCRGQGAHAKVACRQVPFLQNTEWPRHSWFPSRNSRGMGTSFHCRRVAWSSTLFFWFQPSSSTTARPIKREKVRTHRDVFTQATVIQHLDVHGALQRRLLDDSNGWRDLHSTGRVARHVRCPSQSARSW